MVLCERGLPTFTWDGSSVSRDGAVPILIIGFPDGGSDDSAILKPVNPIPIDPNELGTFVDSCIFIGFLLNDPEVTVTLTGCPFQYNFEVSLRLVPSC
jgi:hypothetical protein